MGQNNEVSFLINVIIDDCGEICCVNILRPACITKPINTKRAGDNINYLSTVIVKAFSSQCVVVANSKLKRVKSRQMNFVQTDIKQVATISCTNL